MTNQINPFNLQYSVGVCPKFILKARINVWREENPHCDAMPSNECFFSDPSVINCRECLTRRLLRHSENDDL
jgi:hypothetical protein